MNILGISGLDGAARFKAAQWPGLDARERRIFQGHDAAAALVVDGQVVAACAEERFNRRKHANDFPVQAIGYCLREGGLSVDRIDRIVHAFDYSPYRRLYSMDRTTEALYDQVLSRQSLVALARQHLGIDAGRVQQIKHHLAHAASAYFTSGWDECLVVVIDAMGEVRSASAYHARDNDLELIHQISAQDSIGILYSLVTLHLGFDFNADEYKIMGLAPYGDPTRYRKFFESAVELVDDGSIKIPCLRLNRTRDERENFVATRRYLEEQLTAARTPESDITDQHRDIAAALQACLSRVVGHICGCLADRTGLRRLAMAGGVALNCSANGKLRASGRFDDIYVQPASGDDGAALGAALYAAARNGDVMNHRQAVPFFGPAYPSPCVEKALAACADRVHVHRFSDLAATCETAAYLVAEGAVLGWYRGRMEFGPRALGHRSILADPGRPEMRDRINAMVKKREAFRPFAPAVSLRQAHCFFDMAPGVELPYMIATVAVRPEHRRGLPAVTHVDGSARVQTVSETGHPEFHALLEAVGRRTGREMVLNTSLNVRGQPIVNTPLEAVETYLDTSMDALFIENCMVTRR